MIEVYQLNKSYDAKTVLDGLSFTVNRGEVYGLLGPNGVGKTTAINIICGLLKAHSGQVSIDGKAVSEASKYQLGVVPQEISIYKDLTCHENLVFFSRIYGLTRREGNAKAKELIHLLHLEEYANIEVNKLSGGWQRRINIAVALVHSPSILILDEPTTGLDIEARFELWRLLELMRNSNLTILLTTHLLDEAQALCSRIGIMQKGQIIAEGSLDELRTFVPAQQLAIVGTDFEALFTQKAKTYGWLCRKYAGKLALCLPERMDLKTIIDKFSDIPISSITLQEIGLEHAYLELTNPQPSNLNVE